MLCRSPTGSAVGSWDSRTKVERLSVVRSEGVPPADFVKRSEIEPPVSSTAALSPKRMGEGGESIDRPVRLCEAFIMNANQSVLVKSASRALHVFEAFAEARGVLSLAQLSRALDIPRSSCLALLRTFLSRGYLYQIGANGYYPTRKLYDMAMVIAHYDPLLERVLPVATALRDKTRETVILGKRYGEQVVYLAVVESDQEIRYSAHPGDFKPLHGSASGKVLLAALRDEERRHFLKHLPLPAITRRTITSPGGLEDDLRDGLSRGWQYVEGENVPDVVAIASPVNLNGEVYALVVTGPIHRMKERVETHAQALIEACCNLEGGRTSLDAAYDGLIER
jgi:IclR family transcriptional regulator, acetate operon repressor